MMMKLKGGSMDKVVELIVEFLAKAQIGRREFAMDSPPFNNVTRAILAYGKAPDLLSRLQQLQEEHHSIIADLTDCPGALSESRA
jgi:hypothetical protein